MNYLPHEYGTFIYVDTDSVKQETRYIQHFVYTVENRSSHKCLTVSVHVGSHESMLLKRTYISLLNKIYGVYHPGNWNLIKIEHIGVEPYVIGMQL